MGRFYGGSAFGYNNPIMQQLNKTGEYIFRGYKLEEQRRRNELVDQLKKAQERRTEESHAMEMDTKAMEQARKEMESIQMVISAETPEMAKKMATTLGVKEYDWKGGVHTFKDEDDNVWAGRKKDMLPAIERAMNGDFGGIQEGIQTGTISLKQAAPRLTPEQMLAKSISEVAKTPQDTIDLLTAAKTAGRKDTKSVKTLSDGRLAVINADEGKVEPLYLPGVKDANGNPIPAMAPSAVDELSMYEQKVALKEEAKRKAKMQGDSKQDKKSVDGMIRNLSTTRAMINKLLPMITDKTTGADIAFAEAFPGSSDVNLRMYSAIPGNEDIYKVAKQLETIRGRIGFDQLQDMRNLSKTGGALGQVSERELTFLQSVMGSLDQKQDAEELKRVLTEIYTRLGNTMAESKAAYENVYQEFIDPEEELWKPIELPDPTPKAEKKKRIYFK